MIGGIGNCRETTSTGRRGQSRLSYPRYRFQVHVPPIQSHPYMANDQHSITGTALPRNLLRASRRYTRKQGGNTYLSRSLTTQERKPARLHSSTRSSWETTLRKSKSSNEKIWQVGRSHDIRVQVFQLLQHITIPLILSTITLPKLLVRPSQFKVDQYSPPAQHLVQSTPWSYHWPH